MSFSERSAAIAAPSRARPHSRRRDEQPRQPRMDRQRQHGFTQWRDPRGVAGQGAQKQEQALGCGQPLGFRRVKPIELRRVANAPGVQGEHRAERSTRWISGCSNSGRPRCSRSDQRRMQVPGPVRPALPARWSAEARLIRPVSQRSMPRAASYRTIRARPLSMTVVTPSIVSEVSATFVLRMIFRRSLGRSARSCSSADSDPCSGSTTRTEAGGRRLEPSAEPPDLGKSRQKDQQMA